MFNYFQKKVDSVGWNSTGRKLASGSVDQTARILVFEGNTSIVKMEFV